MGTSCCAPLGRAFTIRTMQPDDAAAVSELAGRVWRAHYPAIISGEQIEYMLSMMYEPAALAKQVEQGHRFWLAEQDGKLAGFVSAEVKKPGHWHLHKLYVDQERSGAGIGGALIGQVIEAAAGGEVSLRVNRMNIQAINFYFRHGFAIDRLDDADIGKGFRMEDFIMIRRP